MLMCSWSGVLGGCQGIAVWLLGYFSWSLGCCYVIAREFCVVARMLLGSCLGILGYDCWADIKDILVHRYGLSPSFSEC